MASPKFVENYYAFRPSEIIVGRQLQPASPNQAFLQAIEAKLVQASNDFYGRRYREAIDAYQDAAGLIYAQINPRFPVGYRTPNLPLDAALFDSLLSVSLEWMNVLPPRQPAAPISPRVQPDPRVLGKTGTLDQIGVVSTALATHPTMSAVADLQAAKTMALQGNTAAADFFTRRGEAQSASTASLFTATAAGAAARPALERVAVELPAPLPAPLTLTRAVGFTRGDQVIAFDWKAGEGPPQDKIKASLFQERIKITKLGDLVRRAQQPSDVAAELPHDYYYVIPLGLAECYHALGDYTAAETKYFQAASYQFLNTAIEAPYLFERLLTLYLDWGNALFREDQAQTALGIYTRVVTPDATAPNSPLYTTASLKPGADVARTVIGNLANLANLNVNPLIASPILEIRTQILKIENGLDFWGRRANMVPIWSFDYLQSVAINFAQLAINAERDFITFRDRADQAALTRQQIAQSVVQSQAEMQAAQLQAAAAAAEVSIYADGVALAQKRATDAAANAAEYAATSAQAIVHQALSAQLSGGDNGDARQLNAYADRMMAGGYRLTGERGTLSAAEQLTALRLNRQYEVDALKRQAAEMALAQQQAQDEVKAAQVRAAAAQANVTVAKLRASAAQENLEVFDNQFFTPDVWYRMGDHMWRLYRRYFDMALQAARLMQQAYNFETDQMLNVIKRDYSSDEVKGLLGADSLMADIQGFAYNLITSKTGKPQPLRQTISLAQSYGFQFEKQFRKTGIMEFSTRIDDFDAVYPGTYAGRIEAIEVNIDGIVPAMGISGTLTNSGISGYRTPGSVQSNPTGLKYRVQNREALVLSDYAVRQDALLVPTDSRMLRVFEGAGLVSAWRLEIPKAINDLDFGAITDVRVTLYYKARFDPDLRDKVLAELAARPGFYSRQRGMPLRWLYPDAFFKFQDTGELKFTLRPLDFRLNETKPIINQIGLLVVGDGTVAAGGLKVSLSTPAKALVTAQTDAAGAISSEGASAWAGLTGGTAIGDYTIKMTAADNPALVAGGKLKLSPIVNIGLILGYSFTPRA